jgi:ribose transport system permease protein
MTALETPTTGLAPATGTASVFVARLKQSAQQLLVFVTLIVLLIGFSIAAPDVFATQANISQLLLAAAVTGIQALGLTFVISTGGIDLTPGLGMAMCSVVMGVALRDWEVPIIVGVLVCVGCGVLLGLVNGTLVAVCKMQPMIATLATMLICQGLALVISGTKPVYLDSAVGFKEIAISRFGVIGSFQGIPMAVVIFFGAAVIAALILNKSPLGRYAVSMGSNEEATRISGIDITRWKIAVYTLTGAFTGLSGVIMAARLNAAQPATGVGYEMYAIAAVVIGGTSLRGGRANILGTVVGALVISTINTGLAILAVPDQWQKVVLGVVVLIAVGVDVLRRRRKGEID